MFLDIDGRKIHSLTFGVGPRTLVAHGGWVGSLELWLHPFEILSQSWRTVTYDHRGTGITTCVPDDIHREGIITDLFAVLDTLGIDRCVLSGESTGALVALLAYFAYPERFDGLVLVDGFPASDDAPGRRDFIASVRQDYGASFKDFVDACVPEPGAEHIRRWARRIGARAESEQAARLIECFIGTNLWDRLGDVRVPTLIIHGSNDRICPLATAQEMARAIPNSRLVVIDGSGHVPTMTYPDRVAAAINSFFGI
jgi:pimeloyl-ACP methyl ester carboxylesterase